MQILTLINFLNLGANKKMLLTYPTSSKTKYGSW